MMKNETIYHFAFDGNGNPFFVETTLFDAVLDSIEDRNTASGVRKGLYTDGCCLMGYVGTLDKYPSLIKECASEEEAYMELIDMAYNHDYQTSERIAMDFSTKKEGIWAVSNIMELPEDVVESLLHWRDVARKIYLYRAISQKTAIINRLYAEFSKGNASRSNIAAVSRLKMYFEYPSCGDDDNWCFDECSHNESEGLTVSRANFAPDVLEKLDYILDRLSFKK